MQCLLQAWHHSSRVLNSAMAFNTIISALFSPPPPTCPVLKSAPFPAALPAPPQHSHHSLIPHSGWTWCLPSSNKPTLRFRDVLSELMSPVKSTTPQDNLWTLARPSEAQVSRTSSRSFPSTRSSHEAMLPSESSASDFAGLNVLEM